MADPTPPASPTGKPVLPPGLVPYLMLGILCLNGGLVALAAAAPSQTVKLVCTIAIATIAPLVAMASPGLRSSAQALLVLAAAALCLQAMPARAQGLPTRSLGGCAGRNNWFCAGPTLSVTLTQLSLKDLTPSGTFEPGLGYGITLFSDQWYTVGLGVAYSLTTPPQGPSTFAPSAVLSFAEYLRIGLMWSKTTGQPPERALLIGMGFELGGGTPQSSALIQAIKSS